MKNFLKRIIVPFSLVTGLGLSTPVFGDYYGGSEGEEIMLNGTVIFGGIGENYHGYYEKYLQQSPIVMMKYKGKLYRCHVELQVISEEFQSNSGFDIHCWSRKRTKK